MRYDKGPGQIRVGRLLVTWKVRIRDRWDALDPKPRRRSSAPRPGGLR